MKNKYIIITLVAAMVGMMCVFIPRGYHDVVVPNPCDPHNLVVCEYTPRSEKESVQGFPLYSQDSLVERPPLATRQLKVLPSVVDFAFGFLLGATPAYLLVTHHKKRLKPPRP